MRALAYFLTFSTYGTHLDSESRRIILEALLSVCERRGWIPHALHIRTTDVHAVIAGETSPERMLADFKAYATRALRQAFSDGERRRDWADEGSTCYLCNQVSLIAAVNYVLNGQGERMAWHERQTVGC